jgi:hypothetical protein
LHGAACWISRGFRYVLELADGQPADPVFFNSALPPETWKPGDTFLAASDLRRFRVLAIGRLEELGLEHADGLWIVEPVDG